MSPFWASLFAELRGRGRNATLFIFAIPIVLAALLLAARVPREAYVEYVLPAATAFALLFALALLRRIVKARSRGRSSQPAPLSRDELTKARSKLVKDTNRKPS
jgi:hypothetical protein